MLRIGRHQICCRQNETRCRDESRTYLSLNKKGDKVVISFLVEGIQSARRGQASRVERNEIMVFRNVVRLTSSQIDCQERRKNIARLTDNRTQNLVIIESVSCSYCRFSFSKGIPNQSDVWSKIVVIRSINSCAAAQKLLEA